MTSHTAYAQSVKLTSAVAEPLIESEGSAAEVEMQSPELEGDSPEGEGPSSSLAVNEVF